MLAMKKIVLDKCCVKNKSMAIALGFGCGAPHKEIKQYGGGLGVKPLG